MAIKSDNRNRLDEFEFIAGICKGRKRIALVGCVGSGADFTKEFLFGYLHENLPGSEIAGFDRNKKGVSMLKDLGYAAFYFDLEKEDFSGKKIPLFDAVIAGGMLDNCTNLDFVFRNFREMLAPNGVLISTVNNALGSKLVWDVMFRGRDPKKIFGFDMRKDYVVSFTPESMLNLFEKFGFENNCLAFFDNFNGFLAKLRLPFNLLHPELGATILIYGAKGEK